MAVIYAGMDDEINIEISVKSIILIEIASSDKRLPNPENITILINIFEIMATIMPTIIALMFMLLILFIGI